MAKTLECDPLLHLIRAYQSGVAVYNAAPKGMQDDEEYLERLAEETFDVPFDALSNAPPALTRACAIEALRLAAKEHEQLPSSPIVGSLISAALAYFERERQ